MARIPRGFLQLALVMLSASAAEQLWCAQAAPGKPANKFPHDCNPTGITDKDIPNFRKVDQDLYRGARPTYRKDVYLKLAELGIRTIVNLETKEALKEEALVKQANQELSARHLPEIKFIHFPISPVLQDKLTGVPDGGEYGIHHLFEELQTAPKPIFLHCEHGKDRTGAIVVIYRMRRHELTFEQAYKEALHYRFNRSSDRGLLTTMRRYRDPQILASLPDPEPSGATGMGVCIGSSNSVPLPIRNALQ